MMAGSRRGKVSLSQPSRLQRMTWPARAGRFGAPQTPQKPMPRLATAPARVHRPAARRNRPATWARAAAAPCSSVASGKLGRPRHASASNSTSTVRSPRNQPNKVRVRSSASREPAHRHCAATRCPVPPLTLTSWRGAFGQYVARGRIGACRRDPGRVVAQLGAAIEERAGEKRRANAHRRKSTTRGGPPRPGRSVRGLRQPRPGRGRRRSRCTPACAAPAGRSPARRRNRGNARPATRRRQCSAPSRYTACSKEICGSPTSAR